MNWRRVKATCLASDPPGFAIAAYPDEPHNEVDYLLWDLRARTPDVIAERYSIPHGAEDRRREVIAKFKEIAEARVT